MGTLLGINPITHNKEYLNAPKIPKYSNLG